MIFGDCPYDDCNEPMCNSMGDRYGFEKLNCEKCGRVIWLLHSRVDPVAYTDKGFRDKYEIDEETKQVKEKTVPS